MKADKPLEWHLNKHFPNLWQSATEFHKFLDSYTVHPREDGGWYVEGADKQSADTEAEAKQICQDHYNRQRRLKAWEDYMLSHEPPTNELGSGDQQ